MKRTMMIGAVLMMGLSFTACKKENNNGSNTYTPTLQYQLNATNTSYSTARTTDAGTIVWTSAFAYPSMIKFEAKQNNLEVAFKSTNNDRIDLFAATAASFGSFSLPAGTYDEIELKMTLDKKNGDPAMQLNGNVSNGLVSLPVMVQVDENLEMKTELHDVTIVNEDTYIAATTIDLADVTSGVTATMLLNADLTGGVIMVNKFSNKDIYRSIVNNLRDKRHHCIFHHHHR